MGWQRRGCRQPLVDVTDASPVVAIPKSRCQGFGGGSLCEVQQLQQQVRTDRDAGSGSCDENTVSRTHLFSSCRTPEMRLGA
ncbi:unnamed protein product, partial [Pylaiella littoralis]